MSFDGILNLSYDINRFYDYSNKNHEVEEVIDAVKSLKKLRWVKKDHGLISHKLFTDSAVSALEMLCEYLTHKDKKYTYVFGGRSRDEIYRCFCGIFKNKNATPTEIYFSMQKFFANIDSLRKTGYLDSKSDIEYNFIYYFNKDCELGYVDITTTLETLFYQPIREDIELLINLNL